MRQFEGNTKLSAFEVRRGKASETEMKAANEKSLRLRDEATKRMKASFDKGLVRKEFVKRQKEWLRNERSRTQRKGFLGPAMGTGGWQIK